MAQTDALLAAIQAGTVDGGLAIIPEPGCPTGGNGLPLIHRRQRSELVTRTGRIPRHPRPSRRGRRGRPECRGAGIDCTASKSR